MNVQRFIIVTDAAVAAANAFAHTFDEPEGGDNFTQQAGALPWPASPTHWWCCYSALTPERLEAWETYVGENEGVVLVDEETRDEALATQGLVHWEEEL